MGRPGSTWAALGSYGWLPGQEVAEDKVGSPWEGLGKEPAVCQHRQAPQVLRPSLSPTWNTPVLSWGRKRGHRRERAPPNPEVLVPSSCVPCGQRHEAPVNSEQDFSAAWQLPPCWF